MLTDSKSLFDVVSKGSTTSGKRIMVDIHSIRIANQSHKISNIGFVRSSENIADGLTKPRVQNALLSLLRIGKHKSNCELWILTKLEFTPGGESV